ncbi:MAG: hypothetical protein AB7I48_20785 [Planctomycetaceae bacterium]
MRHGAADRDKFLDALRGYLIVRCCGDQDRWSREFRAVAGALPAGSEEMRGRSIPDLCWDLVERTGHRPTTSSEAVRMALGESFLLRASDGPAYSTSVAFASVLLDAQRKTLQQSYLDAPASYERWTSVGESVRSYHDLHRVIFNFSGAIQEIPESTPYPEAVPSDSRETYTVRKHGVVFSVSLEALLADDIGAIRRPAAQAGQAMRKAINTDVYRLLCANPAMTDGITIFHATSHGGNLDATALAAGAPIDVGYTVMAGQTSLDGSTIVGVLPRFLIVPAALAATASTIVSSMTTDAAPLEVVADASIDSFASGTAWYLAADPREMETVEVTFLRGEEIPFVTEERGFYNDTIKYKIRQSYGVKALDYRGLYQGNA